MSKEEQDREPQFKNTQEELDYRMRDTDIDYRKLAMARIARAWEDVFTPSQSTLLHERRESLLFLTGDGKYWDEVRAFWCDLTDKYNGAALKEKAVQTYATFTNKVPDDSLPEELRLSLQEELPVYERLCNEIKKEFLFWLRKRNLNYKEHQQKFENSLFSIPFTCPYPSDITQLFTVKEEYDEYFKEIGLDYKINPIIIKNKGKNRSIHNLYRRGYGTTTK